MGHPAAYPINIGRTRRVGLKGGAADDGRSPTLRRPLASATPSHGPLLFALAILRQIWRRRQREYQQAGTPAVFPALVALAALPVRFVRVVLPLRPVHLARLTSDSGRQPPAAAKLSFVIVPAPEDDESCTSPFDPAVGQPPRNPRLVTDRLRRGPVSQQRDLVLTTRKQPSSAQLPSPTTADRCRRPVARALQGALFRSGQEGEGAGSAE